MVIDTCFVFAKHVLDCMYHTKSKNAAKLRNQYFNGEKVNKMAQTMVRVENFHRGLIYSKFTVISLKYSQHPCNFSTSMNFWKTHLKKSYRWKVIDEQKKSYSWQFLTIQASTSTFITRRVYMLDSYLLWLSFVICYIWKITLESVDMPNITSQWALL